MTSLPCTCGSDDTPDPHKTNPLCPVHGDPRDTSIALRRLCSCRTAAECAPLGVDSGFQCRSVVWQEELDGSIAIPFSLKDGSEEGMERLIAAIREEPEVDG